MKYKIATWVKMFWVLLGIMVLFFFYEFQFGENPDSKYLNIFITAPFFIFWVIGGILIHRAYLEITDEFIIYQDGLKKHKIQNSTIIRVHQNPFLFLSPLGVDVGEKYKKVIPCIFNKKKLYVEQLLGVTQKNG